MVKTERRTTHNNARVHAKSCGVPKIWEQSIKKPITKLWVFDVFDNYSLSIVFSKGIHHGITDTHIAKTTIIK